MIERALLSALLWSAAACAQAEPKPQPAQDPKQAIADMQKAFAEQGIVVDEKAQTVSIPVEFIQPPDPLEYLLIHKKGKRHETLLITNAKPSVLNGALLLIGLEPGANANYKEKVPAPTLAEIEKGADPIIVIPPKGQPIWLTVQWKDEEGKEHEVTAEDLLLELSTGKPVGHVDWIYIGGRMAALYRNEAPVYVADYEGNLVSTCYMHPDNHLVTMAHPKSRDEQNWWISEAAPKPGTKGQLLFHKKQPKVSIEREARLKAEAKQEAEKGKSDGKEPSKDGKDGK
jgi:hypothetical protein